MCIHMYDELKRRKRCFTFNSKKRKIWNESRVPWIAALYFIIGLNYYGCEVLFFVLFCI